MVGSPNARMVITATIAAEMARTCVITRFSLNTEDASIGPVQEVRYTGKPPSIMTLLPENIRQKTIRWRTEWLRVDGRACGPRTGNGILCWAGVRGERYNHRDRPARLARRDGQHDTICRVIAAFGIRRRRREDWRPGAPHHTGDRRGEVYCRAPRRPGVGRACHQPRHRWPIYGGPKTGIYV